MTTYFVTEKPTEIRSRCPACAAEQRAREDARKEAEQAEERNRRVVSLFGRSGIPARFANRTFAGYEAKHPGQRMALNVCRAFADGWAEKRAAGTSLVLTGSPGTGKTHLACAIGGHVIREHLGGALFVTVSMMLRAIKETYRKDSPRSEQDVIDELVAQDLLIVDEIGVQVGSEHEKLLMFEVLNGRYQDMRPTILISNLSAEDLEAYLGHRVMDRYRECGAVLAFDWESHRGAA